MWTIIDQRLQQWTPVTLPTCRLANRTDASRATFAIADAGMGHRLLQQWRCVNLLPHRTDHIATYNGGFVYNGWHDNHIAWIRKTRELRQTVGRILIVFGVSTCLTPLATTGCLRQWQYSLYIMVRYTSTATLSHHNPNHLVVTQVKDEKFGGVNGGGKWGNMNDKNTSIELVNLVIED